MSNKPSDESILTRSARRIRREGLRKLAQTRRESLTLLRGAGQVVTAPMRLVERRSHTVGLAPGTLIADPEDTQSVPGRIDVIHYGPDDLVELADVDVATARRMADETGVTWINLDGVGDIEMVAAMGEAFGLHPLVQEDLTHTSQRPKVEPYDDYLFVVLKMVRPVGEDAVEVYCRGESGHQVEQVALVLGPGYVLSFQEDDGDVFEPVRERLRSTSGTIREQGPDYLLYALLDLVVDHYYITLERIGDATELFEDLVFDNPGPSIQEALSALRREVVVLRRAIWPLREVLNAMMREDTPGFTDRTRVYLRDVYDHLVQAVDILESLREVLGGLADLYLSALSHKMNEVMKVLTVVGSIFIPLSFLTGLYGMNFQYIPELQYRNGYFVFMGCLVVLTAATLAYFRKRDWI